jgi:hypothetical protein
MGARQCRELAKSANSTDWRDKLLEIADDLDREADAVDRIEGRLAGMNMPQENDETRTE